MVFRGVRVLPKRGERKSGGSHTNVRTWNTRWQLADLMEAALAQPATLGALLAAEQGFQNAPLLLQAVAATVKVIHVCCLFSRV